MTATQQLNVIPHSCSEGQWWTHHTCDGKQLLCSPLTKVTPVQKRLNLIRLELFGPCTWQCTHKTQSVLALYVPMLCFWMGSSEWVAVLSPSQTLLSRMLAQYLVVLSGPAARGWAGACPAKSSPGWLTQHLWSSHSCGKGGGQLLCYSLLCLAQLRYQVARLPPALICVQTPWEQPGLLALGFVCAGVSPPDFCAREADKEKFVLHSSRLNEWVLGTLVSLWAMIIVPADVLRGPSVVQCWVWVHWHEDKVCILQRIFFLSFNGLNSFWMHLLYQTMLHFRMKGAFPQCYQRFSDLGDVTATPSPFQLL